MKIENINNLNPEHFLVAGDWHGNIAYAKKVIKEASESGIKVIIHVGDFGWGFGKDGYYFDKPLRLALEKYDMIIIWIDGNHDNHDLIRSLPVRSDGFVQTGKGERLYWAPRGHRWSWGGKTLAALGGAFSINYQSLQEGKTWFPEIEEVSERDITTLGREKVDILFTHEVPTGVNVKKTFDLPEDLEEKSRNNRDLLFEAVYNTQPEFVFSGHWHQRITEKKIVNNSPTTFSVLNREWETGNSVLVTIDEVLETVEMREVDPQFNDIKRWVLGASELVE